MGFFDGLEPIVAGTKEQSPIKTIDEGIQDDFRTEEYWAYVKEKENIAEQKQLPAVKITTENGATLVMTKPKTSKYHPKSIIALFVKTYGKMPFINQVVTTKVDEKGFYKIVLEMV